MPSTSHDQKSLYKARIRSLLVQKPFITQTELKTALEAEGLRLDRKYLGGLLNATYRERAARANTWALNTALSSFQDAMEEIARVGWEIATDERRPGRDRAAALREVREAYNATFEKLFDAGVFERKNGTIELQIRNKPLDDDRKQAIRSVFENWGILTPPTITEQLVHADVEALTDSAAEMTALAAEATKEDADASTTPTG